MANQNLFTIHPKRSQIQEPPHYRPNIQHSSECIIQQFANFYLPKQLQRQYANKIDTKEREKKATNESK